MIGGETERVNDSHTVIRYVFSAADPGVSRPWLLSLFILNYCRKVNVPNFTLLLCP